MFYHSLFGIGFLSSLDFHCFYALAFFLHAVLGWMLAVVLKVPSLFSGKSGCCKRKQLLEKDGTCPMPDEQTATVMYRRAWAYRFAMGIVIAAIFVATALAFELIPLYLSPLGIIVSFVGLIIAHTLFYLAFSIIPIKSSLKRWQAVYIFRYMSGSEEKVGDMTGDVVVYLAMYFVPMTWAFCATFVWAPWWWQFWTALIIFGFYLILFLIAAVSWLRRATREKAKRLMNSARTKVVKTVAQQ